MVRIPAERALAFAEDVLRHHGLSVPHRRAVAENLIASDLLGHRTHGLAKLAQYVEMLKHGDIAREGEIEVRSDHGSSLSWNANRLPGAWVVGRCLEVMLERIDDQPVVAATIANCSHIGCLQTYLEPIARRGIIAMLMASDPAVATVAPFGAIDPVLGPNPIAMGIPTQGDPVLIDQCTSTVSNSEVRLAADAGRRLRGPWLLDNAGQATDDPSALSAVPRGTIMPLGGADLGHKGFGFGLMVEALALALSGYGRSGPPKRAGGQGVFVQLINPRFFAGAEAFGNEFGALAGKIKAARPSPGRPAPRLPGERALSSRREQMEGGIEIDTNVLSQLERLAVGAGLEALSAELA